MEVRTAVTRNGGTMADPGSVSRLFTRKGVVVVPKAQEGREVSEDDVLEATLDAGAEDVNDLGDTSRSSPRPATWSPSVRRFRRRASTTTPPRCSSCATWTSRSTIDVAGKVFRLVDAVDDLDDVQNVFTNADIPDDVLESIDA